VDERSRRVNERVVSRAVTRPRASARLGLALRSVLIAPRRGIAATMALADRRARSGRRVPEGAFPYVLSAIGGAGLMLLWLKLSVLVGLRSICPQEYRAAYVAMAVVVGAVLGLIALTVWSGAGRLAAGRSAAGTHLRVTWGAAALPQVAAVAVLLPFDLVLVGPETFTSAPVGDTVSMVWAALSVAFALSLTAWSLFIVARGVQVIGGGGAKRAVAGLAVALLCIGLVFGAFLGAATALGTEGACPT
jgi:hypothetical protein